MKQTLLSRLILVGLAGVAATAVQAGQIQASSTSIAREAINSDTTLSVVAPSTSYRFFGDVDATVQTQVFQVQLTLQTAGLTADTVASAGLFDTTITPTPDFISLKDGIGGGTIAQGAAANQYQVIATGYSTDKKTLWVTLSVNATSAIIKQPIVTFNATTATTPVKYTKLKSVTGDLVTDYAAGAAGLDQNCSAVKKMPVGVRHFVALSAPSSIADGTTNGSADEHTRSSSTNDAVSIVFPTNVGITVTPSTTRAILTPGGNLTFTDNGGAGTSWVNANFANLGNFKLSQLGTGYDNSLASTSTYSISKVAANGLLGTAAAASLRDGTIESSGITVAVKSDQGFVNAAGGNLFLSTAANCGAAIVGSTTATAGAGLTLNVPLTVAGINAGSLSATGDATIYVCYQVPGTATIPSSKFTSIVTVNKAPAGAGFDEQPNACGGNLYSLGGGLKIDVRNYASSAETGGYISVLRFINNSDNAKADVWAQHINQDGKLGNWAKIADLPVRGVVNMTATQIDAKLAAGSAATVAVASKGTAAPTAQQATATTNDTAPRLRITSTTGKSLRVQNYLFNSATGQILEGSGQQGVDTEGSVTRAPLNEGQYQDQDANSGLNLAP